MLQRFTFRSPPDFVPQRFQNFVRQPLVVIQVKIESSFTQRITQQILNTQPRRLDSLALEKRGRVLD
jgi:hypothetical protein